MPVGKGEQRGSMSVSDAGRKGGQSTSRVHGADFYRQIGQKGGEVGGKRGGARVRELIAKGKQVEQQESEVIGGASGEVRR